MGWTIATFLERAFLLVLMPVLLVILYHLVKSDIKELMPEPAKEQEVIKPPLCKECNVLRVDEWACPHTIQDGDYLCVDCCKCPDHTLPHNSDVVNEAVTFLFELVTGSIKALFSLSKQEPEKQYQVYYIETRPVCQGCFVMAMNSGQCLVADDYENSLLIHPKGYVCMECFVTISNPSRKEVK